jgi:hypothetical protein
MGHGATTIKRRYTICTSSRYRGRIQRSLTPMAAPHRPTLADRYFELVMQTEVTLRRS